MSSELKMLPMRLEAAKLQLDGTLRLDINKLELTDPGITCIMGFNGAGKSLLLRLMHGLLQADSGLCLFDEHPLDDVLRRAQAMVFQKPVLLRRSVQANIEFVLKSRGMPCDTNHVESLLAKVDLAGCEKQPARKLSGGEQQRLVLARALATQPGMLFLDEATASLDPASVQLIESVVSSVSKQGCKVIMVTHDAAQARRLCDDVIFIHEGWIAEHSPASQFFQNPKSAPGRAYLAGEVYVHKRAEAMNTAVTTSNQTSQYGS